MATGASGLSVRAHGRPRAEQTATDLQPLKRSRSFSSSSPPSDDGISCDSSPDAVGVDSDVAVFRRRFGALIWRVGIDLKLHAVTVATAALYFQRFFMVESRDRFDANRVAIACMWLATKVREDGRRLRDIANSFTALAGREKEAKAIQMEEYWMLRDDLVVHEQAVLRAMAFDTEPTTAYTFVAEFVWLLGCDTGDGGVAALSWTLLNDAFCSEICALWAPARVASACVLVAIELGRRVPELKAEAERMVRALDRLSREPHLEDFLGFGQNSGADEIEDICRDLLASYEADHAPAKSNAARR